MITATWRVERLETSNEEYQALKDAGLNTFGDMAALPADKLAAKAKISSAAAEKLLSQIEELTRAEESDAACASYDVIPENPPSESPVLSEEEWWETGARSCTAPASLEELHDYPKETITPEMAAGILGCDPQSIRSQAQLDAGALGFPVIVMGREVKIPRRGFIYFMEYGRTSVQHRG